MIECNLCNKEFSGKDNLRTHKKRIHTEPSSNLQDCELCGKQIKGKPITLKKHIEAVHLRIQHPCNSCSYQATTKQSLKIHMEAQHSNTTLVHFQQIQKEI